MGPVPPVADVPRAYLAALEPAAPGAAKALRRQGRLSRGGAAEALAAAGALLPLALARHQQKRAAEPRAVQDVIGKYGRTGALGDPAPVLRERLADPDLSARLGGLLGDDGPRVAAWLAPRTGDDALALGRSVASCAPLLLAALGRAGSAEAIDAWLRGLDLAALGEPARLATDEGFAGTAFRALRGKAFPWWTRVLP